MTAVRLAAMASMALAMNSTVGLLARGQEPPRNDLRDSPTLADEFADESNALGERGRREGISRQRGLTDGLGRLAGWRRRASWGNPWTVPWDAPPGLPMPPWGQSLGFGPWSMMPSGPWGSPFNSARQPIGHEMIPNGKGGYTYRPLYEPETEIVPQPSVAKPLPSQSRSEPQPTPRREAPGPAPEEIPLGNREAVDL